MESLSLEEAKTSFNTIREYYEDSYRVRNESLSEVIVSIFGESPSFREDWEGEWVGCHPWSHYLPPSRWRPACRRGLHQVARWSDQLQSERTIGEGERNTSYWNLRKCKKLWVNHLGGGFFREESRSETWGRWREEKNLCEISFCWTSNGHCCEALWTDPAKARKRLPLPGWRLCRIHWHNRYVLERQALRRHHGCRECHNQGKSRTWRALTCVV